MRYTLFSGWTFLHHEGRWTLSYDETPYVRWNHTPEKDPTSLDPSATNFIENEGEYDKFELWLKGAEKFLQACKLPVLLAVDFHKECVNAGFDFPESGYLEYWVYEKMAEIIHSTEQK